MSTTATAVDEPAPRLDRVHTAVGAAVVIDALANDATPEPRTLQVRSIADAPAHGSASVVAGLVNYQPDPSFRGVDLMRYRVEDSNGQEAVGEIEIDVGDTTTAASTAIGWRACTPDEIPGDETFREQMQCATVRVPVSYAQPDGATLELFVSRHPSPNQPSLGPLFVNQGGPGAEAATYAPSCRCIRAPACSTSLAWTREARAARRRSPVGRTSGTCLPPPCRNQVSPRRTSNERWRRSPRDAPLTRTSRSSAPTTSPGDIDRIREFIGADTITYFGKSYGSDLGATYLSLFPSRVRAMVLDGATDLTLEPTEFYIQQARRLQRQVERYLEHCRAVVCRWTNGLDPGTAWAQLIDRLRPRPLTASSGDALTAGAVLDFTRDFRETPTRRSTPPSTVW